MGIRQSSLYHHFGTKDDILAELLDGTVAGGLAFAGAVHASPPPPGPRAAAARMHAVALYDGSQLCSARWNLGVLYHLPEARAPRFQRFMDDRLQLRQLYRELGQTVEEFAPADPWPGAASFGDLLFRLVESLINLRADGLADADSAMQTADAGIVLAGMAADLDEIRATSTELIREFG